MSEIPEAIMAALTSYVLRYGGMCRDCADENGTCPTSGMPCDPDVCRPVVRRTIKALAYGIEHGFIASPFAERTRALSQLEAGKPAGHVAIAHDGFSGDIIGHYTTREGKRGVVVQQDGTRVVHVYGEKWLSALSSPSPAPEAEPVAWQRRTNGFGWIEVREEDIPHYRNAGNEIRPLYTTPTPAVDADAVIEAMARAMCEVWYYAPIGTPDGDREWRNKQAQYRKQAQAALDAVIEACAKIADAYIGGEYEAQGRAAEEIAAEIRALSLPPSADKGE